MRLRAVFFAGLSSISVASGAAAADYYVAATGGSNSATGTSATTAWATLQYAADRVNPGDTVHALPGNHVGFNLGRGGTASAPIRFVAEGAGVNITTRNSGTQDGVN